MIDSKIIESVRLSYGRCISTGNFIEDFYSHFLAVGSRVKDKFINTDFEQQYHLLKHGLNLVIMFASDSPAGKKGLTRIQDSHQKSKMNIEPDLYPLWKESLIRAIAEHDRNFDDQINHAWSEVLDYGITYIVDGYDRS